MSKTEIPKDKLLQLYYIDNLTIIEIGKLYNVSRKTICRRLYEYNIPIKRRFKIRNYLEYEYKYIKVLNKIKDGGSYDKIWNCECICGRSFLISQHQLQHKQSSCGCMSGRNENKFNKFLNSDCKQLHFYWSFVIQGAKSRNLQVNITPSEAYDLFLQQNELCAFTGIKLKLPQSKLRYKDTASLDRINNKLEYNIDNIQWIHKKINIMRMGLPIEEFQYWCKLITTGGYKWMLNNTEIEKHIPEKYFKITKRSANSRGLIFDITIDDMYDKLLRQNFRCIYTGVPISFQDKTASIDRINPLFGYLNENIQWTHKTVNAIKFSFQPQEFFSYCNNIYEYHMNKKNPNILRWPHEPDVICQTSPYKQHIGPIYAKTDLYPNVW